MACVGTARSRAIGFVGLMAIDPPYRLDPLQNPVNVKWSRPMPGADEGQAIFIWASGSIIPPGHILNGWDFVAAADSLPNAEFAAALNALIEAGYRYGGQVTRSEDIIQFSSLGEAISFSLDSRLEDPSNSTSFIVRWNQASIFAVEGVFPHRRWVEVNYIVDESDSSD